MKVVVLSLAAISLAQFVYAQPHGRHDHGKAHLKRAMVTVTETAYAEPTGDVHGEVVVLVNQDGVIVETATNFIPNPTPAPAAPAAPPPVVPSPVVAVAVSSSAPAVPSNSPAPPATGSGFGVAYNPYDTAGNCKTQYAVADDISRIAAAGFTEVRIYGVDCNGIQNVYPAVKSHGMTLIVGVFDIYNVASEVASIIAAVKDDWTAITACLVGNERVNTGTAVGTVLGAVANAKSLLRAGGFKGFVATADTMVATLAHPELCKHDDNTPCYTNDHPFFNSNVAPSGAGAALLADIASLKALLAPNQQIIISETGYPSCGDTHGAAAPSPAGQAAAIASIKSAFAGNPGAIYLLTPMSSAWKNDFAGSNGAEKCWGFM